MRSSTIARSRADVWVDLHDYDEGNPYHQPFIAHAHVLQLSDEHVGDAAALLHRLIAAQPAVRLAVPASADTVPQERGPGPDVRAGVPVEDAGQSARMERRTRSLQ